MSRTRSAALAGVAALAACELQEVTIAVPEDLVVVDALAQVPGPATGGDATVRVLLHRTEGVGAIDVPDARVTVGLPDGTTLDVPRTPTPDDCALDRPPSGTGTCHFLTFAPIEPGMRLELDVETSRGEILYAATDVPAALELRGAAPVCALPSDTPLELVWTRSDGAWAYIAETEIYGLGEALAPLGIDVPVDPLPLLGLSVSASDTTIVFPGELGVFDRADLDRDLAVYLQGGLPTGTMALILITAVDRNYVNWVRGGSFNPSGSVRVPSVRGDGTGFFGSGVFTHLQVWVDPPPVGGMFLPNCL
jgi:hypothetical protein